MQSKKTAGAKSPYCKAATTLHSVLFSMLSMQDLDAYARTSKDNLASTRRARAARLLQQVVYGNQQNATRMLKLDPELLLIPATATDYSGRTIKGVTAFQAAIAAGDMDMAEMMKQVFAKLENSQAILAAQFNKVFPNGIDAIIKVQQAKVYNLDAIVKAISEAKPAHIQSALSNQLDSNISLHASLNKFRESFTKLSHAEFIYNPYHLLQAFTVYDNNYNPWGWRQCDLFWRQVIGFMQRYLPANYAQAFAQGLYDIVEKRQPLKRNFKFRGQDGVTIFPLAPSLGLGFEWAALAASAWCGVGGEQIVARLMAFYLHALSNKLIRLGALTQYEQMGPVASSAKIVPQRL